MYNRNFEISWNFYKKGINYELNYELKLALNAHKFATFWKFSKSFYH